MVVLMRNTGRSWRNVACGEYAIDGADFGKIKIQIKSPTIEISL